MTSAAQRLDKEENQSWDDKGQTKRKIQDAANASRNKEALLMAKAERGDNKQNTMNCLRDSNPQTPGHHHYVKHGCSAGTSGHG